jgi:hypothetical protein
VPGFHVTKDTLIGDLVVGSNALYVGPTHYYGFNPDAHEAPYYYTRHDKIQAYDPDTGAVDNARTHDVKNLSGFTTIGKELFVAQRGENDLKFPTNLVTVYGADGKKERSFVVPANGYVSYLTNVGGDLLAVGSFKRPGGHGRTHNTAMLRFDTHGVLRTGFDPKLNGPVYDAVVQGKSIYASGLFSWAWNGSKVLQPGLTKMSLSSKTNTTFRPSGFESNRVLLRLSPVGQQLWVGWWRNKFVDALTGEVVPDPTGGYADDISSVVRANGGLDFSSIQYGVNIGGSSWNVMGYVGRTD